VEDKTTLQILESVWRRVLSIARIACFLGRLGGSGHGFNRNACRPQREQIWNRLADRR